MAEKGKKNASGLKGALEKLQSTYGIESVARMKDMQSKHIEFLSSGSLKLDLALGGGYAKGRIIEIYGPESSGKTTLTLHAIAEVQKFHGVVAFIDAEHAFDPDYAEAIGVDVDELVFSQPDSAEQALEMVEGLVKSGEVDMIIIDSVAALTPQREIDGEMGDAMIGIQAKLMSQAMRKLKGPANVNACTLIFINQIRMKVGVTFGSPETTPGGQALKFYASQRIDIRRIGSVKASSSDDTLIANEVKITIKKNKVAPPFRKALTRIGFGEGIQKTWEILDTCISLGIIKKGGSWFSYEGTKLGQGEVNVTEMLKDNPDLCAELISKIYEEPIKKDTLINENQDKSPAEESEE